ncbi:MAG: 2-dehydropantoate 2-reductase [Chloroflexota bacterium]
MRIAVMGSGGVGGYYGGLLARAGHGVTFVARGAHLAALRQKGLLVRSVHGDFTIAPAQATDTPAEIGLVDWVLVCVKTPDTEQAAQDIRPLVGPKTVVTSLQNGIDAGERLGAVLGLAHVIGGATWISAAVESPGVIRQFSQIRRVVLGEFDGPISARVRRLAEALGSAAATVEVTDDIRRVLWTKFVFIAAISGIGALTRLEMGDYRAVPETRAVMVALMREVEAVARASGVALAPDVIQQTLAVIDGFAADTRASMQRDVEAGRRSELESLIGVIGRRGRELGIATPVADVVYATLLPVESKHKSVVR